MTTAAQQDWFDAQKAASREPHPERQVVREDRTFTHNLGKRCPWCGDVFFTYQLEGHERQPYRTDAEITLDWFGRPAGGVGTRETCGNPTCHEAEDHHQFQRRVLARAEHAKHAQVQAGPAPTTKGKP